PAATALKPTASISERRTATPASEKSAPVFGEAVSRNSQLKYELTWEFGGKQQRGWYLYVPLISRMLKTEGEAAGGDFADALARWQSSAGLRA
ncbi:MAG: hypothetical protein ABR556_14140, partial [Pyrinomonadaceae bacterium]